MKKIIILAGNGLLPKLIINKCKLKNICFYVLYFSKKNIIVENSEKNIIDFFSYKNFVNASLLKIEIENENSIYYYNFYNNILLISFDNSQSMVEKISLFQAENSIFECKIVDIKKYQNPLKFLNIDDSWTTIDWR